MPRVKSELLKFVSFMLLLIAMRMVLLLLACPAAVCVRGHREQGRILARHNFWDAQHSSSKKFAMLLRALDPAAGWQPFAAKHGAALAVNTLSSNGAETTSDPLMVQSISPATKFSEGMGNKAAEKLDGTGLKVKLLPCLDDNYCPVLHHEASGSTIIMDTPEAAPVIAALKAEGWTLTQILNTHHHYDHVGGNVQLKQEFPSVQIIGPGANQGLEHEKIPLIDRPIAEGDVIDFGDLHAQVIDVPGHTDGHVAYFFPEIPLLLAGDALFTMGCGRVFTGDFVKKRSSMAKLRKLPDETVVYCAHEYTAANAKFARQVEPDNLAVIERAKEVESLRSQGLPTVPTLLAHEKATNPFLRWDVPEVMDAVGSTDADDVFTAVRKWKDMGTRPRISKR